MHSIALKWHKSFPNSCDKGPLITLLAGHSVARTVGSHRLIHFYTNYLPKEIFLVQHDEHEKQTACRIGSSFCIKKDKIGPQKLETSKN